LRGLRRPLRTATLIIAAEFGRYAASRGAPVVRDRGLNARYLVAIPSSALGRLRAAVGFTVNDRNRCTAVVHGAALWVRKGSVAPVRHADKPTLTTGGVHSSIEIANANNREQRTLLVLAAERRRLHLITGRSEWRVRSERRAGCGRLFPFAFKPES
jgi:hypothetical protein